MAILVAISQRVVKTTTYVEVRDALAQDWQAYFDDMLPDSVLLPVPNNMARLPDWLNALRPQLVVLSNGDDWGETPDRDRVELALIDYALGSKVPLFAVCRGLQVINLRFGGKVAALGPEHGPHVGARHDIAVEQGVFRDIARENRVAVNSFHNLGVLPAQVAPALAPFAITDTGVIEGLYHRHEAILAVQWHPERWVERDNFGSRLLQRLVRQGAFWSERAGAR